MDTQTPTSTETLLGGKKFVAQKRDGTSEEIFIRQIGAEECPTYLELQDNELKMVEFVCTKPDGWAKSLAPECHEELIAEVDRINADFFSRWTQRQLRRQERLFPGITEKRMSALLPSPTSLPKAPSSAA
jgi:hypothetical protein